MGREHGKNYINISLVVFFISSVNVSSSFNVSITSRRTTNTVSVFTCTSTMLLEECQIRVADLYTNATLTLDSSAPGPGCTLKLPDTTMEDTHLYAVACRARNATSDWVYDVMSVYKEQAYGEPKTRYHLYLQVLPRQEANFILLSNLKITQCQLKLHTINLTVTDSKQNDCIDGYCLTKYPQNLCAVNISTVTNSGNGIYLYKLFTVKYAGHTAGYSTAHEERGFFYVVVAKPPTHPLLKHEILEDQNGTKTLTATCTVTGSRPAAILTWYLDGVRIEDGRVRSVVREGWLWPHEEQTTSQRLTLTLTPEHANKVVTCEASHLAANGSLIEEFVIIETASTAATTTPTTVQSTLSTPSIKSLTPSSDPDTYHYHEINARLRVYEKKTKTWFPVITALLVILLILVIALTVLYCLHVTSLCFCCRHPTRTGVVKYRKSLEPSSDAAVLVGAQEMPYQPQNPRTTDSSLSQASVTTGVEFAEIRTSMVQRCVDKINASSPRPSSETGEITQETMRSNSLYMSYGDQPM